MSETAVLSYHNEPWKLPSRGVVGMLCLILAEAAIFIIFVVAYIFYIGKASPVPRRTTFSALLFSRPFACYQAA